MNSWKSGFSTGIALFLTACAVHSVGTTISPEHIGSKYARLSGYFATRAAAPGGSHKEGTPGSIRHDVLLDEAVLMSSSISESCFETTIRMDSAHDEPLAQLHPTCNFGGDDMRAVVEDERVSVYDYSYAGSRNLVEVEGVSATQYFGMAISEPTQEVFRVVERRGRVCCPAGGARITLDFTHPDWDVADYNYHLVFNWKIQ